jgi:condensin complex subunit 1
MNKLLDVIMSGFAAEVDAAAHDIDHEDQQTCATHKVLTDMYAFLLNWSAAWWRRSAKSRKGRGGKATQWRVTSKSKAAEWSWKD